MLATLGHLLPIAVAVAASSVPITATLLILLSPRRTQTARPFLLGWLAGMAVVVVAGVFGARALPSIPTRPHAAAGILTVLIGLALIVLAIAVWRRSADRARSTPGRWLSGVTSLSPAKTFVLAFALNLRPKGLLLGAAAAVAVSGGSLRPAGAVLAVVFYLVVAGSTVAGPVVATLVEPQRMVPRLTTASTWLSENSRTVTCLMMLMIGTVLVGAGLTWF